MGGTGAARGGWTWRKLVQHVNARKPVVINQFSHRQTSGGQPIPPPSHIKVIVCIRHCQTGEDGKGDYEGDLVIRASVPYDVLQLELGENERLAWRHVLDWIQRMGHRKFGHVCYPETAGGGPVIDFQRLFAPCNDEERNLDRHFQVGDGQSCFLRSGTVPIPVRGPRNGAARRRARFEPEQHHGARRERRPSPAPFCRRIWSFSRRIIAGTGIEDSPPRTNRNSIRRDLNSPICCRIAAWTSLHRRSGKTRSKECMIDWLCHDGISSG